MKVSDDGVFPFGLYAHQFESFLKITFSKILIFICLLGDLVFGKLSEGTFDGYTAC